MRAFFLCLGLTCATLLRAAELPSLLEEAVGKVAADLNHWAYTQTVVEKDGKGRVLKTVVLRVDPSRPYAELYTPVSIDGHPPSAGDLRKYRREGERVGARIAKAESSGNEPVHQTLGEAMDLANTRVVDEDAAGVSYEVPLKREGNLRFPPEKFRVTVRVNRETRAFEHIDVHLRESLRTALIVKIKSAGGHLEFGTVDPRFAPAITSIHGDGAGSVALIPLGRSYDLQRADFKRVKPYGDRFGVQIGPLRAIDF